MTGDKPAKFKLKIKTTIAKDASSAKILQALLESRGLTDQDKQKKFLHPERPTVESFSQFLGIKSTNLRAVKKIIEKSIRAGEDICVYGDYDADGITATAILWQTLHRLSRGSKARVLPFIPDRRRHGYGLSPISVDEIMSGKAFGDSSYANFRPSLLITVDNGIVADEGIRLLKANGVKTIITDHHQKSDKLLAADAILHSTNTSGAGISWLISHYLAGDDKSYDLMGIAAIGIVADQIELTGENRALVKHGLKELMTTKNKGLQSLFKSAGLGDKKITTDEINYAIAPRLNAVGRLGSALDGLRLLCESDKTSLTTLTTRMEKQNSERQTMTETAIKDATLAPPTHNATVRASESYHEGIVGLIASKLVEKYSRPALALSIGDVVKGSARSFGEIDITKFLRQFSHLLLGVGGHKYAAGFSLKKENLATFRQAIEEASDKQFKPSDLVPSLTADAELELASCTLTLAKLLTILAPFGPGNERPRFVSRNLAVIEDRKIGRSGEHRKLQAEDHGVTRTILWWNGERDHPLTKLNLLVYYLDINSWNNKENVQLIAKYVE